VPGLIYPAPFFYAGVKMIGSELSEVRQVSDAGLKSNRDRSDLDMKIILQQDVPNLGKMGELKDVAPGYARNHLLPRKMAVEATPQRMREWEKQQKKEEAINRQLEEEARQQAEKLSGQVLVFKMPAGEGGRLFGSVTSADVAEKLAENGIEADKKKIEFPEPIKSIGLHTASVRLHQGVTAELKIEVEKDEN